MRHHEALFAVAIAVGVLGFAEVGLAAAVGINASLETGEITVTEANEMWAGSVATFRLCKQAAKDPGESDLCFSQVLDPDQILAGVAVAEFVFEQGRPFDPPLEEALLRVDAYVNNFVGEPEIFNDANGGQSLRRRISFDAIGQVPEGVQDVLHYELFDATNDPSGVSAFVTVESFDLLDDDTGLVFSFSPNGVTTNGFSVRQLIVDEPVDSHTAALDIVQQRSDGAVFDGTGRYDTVNFGGNGTFAGDEPFPDGGPLDGSQDDYIMLARSFVDVPQGEWAIAFGTDDGGQLTLPGIEFEFTVNEDDPLGNPDQLFFDANRGHDWTGGVFKVDQGIENVPFFASMHERGGLDSFEVAICDNVEGSCFPNEASTDVSAENGWVLLTDRALNWRVGRAFRVNPDGALTALFERVELPFVSGSINSNGMIVLSGKGELLGVDLSSAEGLLEPATSPDPFSFLLSNDPNSVVFGNLGTNVRLDGNLVLPVGYGGNDPETDITAAWGMGQTPVTFAVVGRLETVAFDCNGDGVLDEADLSCACGTNPIDQVIAALGLIPGDLNADGSVSFADFLVVSTNFSQRIFDYRLGDIDCSGSVGFSDFLVLSTNFGKSAAGSLSVPEPSSFYLAIIVAVLAAPLRCGNRLRRRR